MALRSWMIGLTSSLVLGALGVAACGGDDTISPTENDGGGGTDGSVITDASQGSDTSTSQDAGTDAEAAKVAACQAIVSAYCNKVEACAPGILTSTCAALTDACPNLAFGGGTAMNVDQANACAAQIDSVSCAEIPLTLISPLTNFATPPFAEFSACNVPGTRGAGDSCDSNLQCASLFCASPESNLFSAFMGAGIDGKCGTCAPTFGPNDDCTAGAVPPPQGGPVCPPQQACDPTTKRCRTIDIGDPCVSGVCNYGAACAPNPDGGPVGICAKRGAPGEACAAGSPFPCAGSGYCAYGDAAHDDGGTCVAGVATGADCTGTSLANPICAKPGEYCLPPTDGGVPRCGALPTDGQPCFNGTDCDPFTEYCDQRVADKPTCRKLVANGQPCGVYDQTYSDGGLTGADASVDCMSGACSQSCAGMADGGLTGTCVGETLGGQENDSCGNDVCTTCAPGLNCVSGKCAKATLHCD